MAETRFRSFPVVIGALLIGMISREDILRALARAAAGIRPRSGAGSWRDEPVAEPGRGTGEPAR
jgi:CBS domain-containing protein